MKSIIVAGKYLKGHTWAAQRDFFYYTQKTSRILE
jgi:hypothetical protein